MSLDQQDVVKLDYPFNFLDPLGGNNRNALNFNYIIKTGEVPDLGLRSVVNGPEFRIDLNANDAFAHALKEIENQSNQRIGESPDLQKLLHKDIWSKEDRVKWEAGVSEIVNLETIKIPAFVNYRTDKKINNQDVRTNAKNIRRENDLSSDIEHGTETQRFDCEDQSIIKGIIIQKIENSHLPAQAKTADFKKASSYFFVAGGVTFGDSNAVPLDHASIFTPAGNLIEATEYGKDGYVEALYNNSTLERLARGHPFVAKNGSVYDQPMAVLPQAAKIRESEQAAHSADREDGQIFSRYQLWQRDGQNGVRLTEAREDGFIVAAGKNAAGVYEMKVFQKQMANTAQEGYVMVGYAAEHDAARCPPTLSTDYHDSLTGKTYKFTSGFANNTVETDIACEHRTLGVEYGAQKVMTSNVYMTPQEIQARYGASYASQTGNSAFQTRAGIGAPFNQAASAIPTGLTPAADPSNGLHQQVAKVFGASI